MEIKGCWVALVTPFRDGEIDDAALNRLVDRAIEGGVDGLVPCGTTGESPTLSGDEQLGVISTVVARAAGRTPVLAGTGTNSTYVSIERSRRAIDAGADAVMLVSPYYNKPSQRGLAAHFAAIAESVDAPVVLYNIPARTGVEISIETICRLRAEHPNIVAVKHATGSVEGAAALAAASDIAVLSGDDTLTVPLMSVGATGVISVVANLLPRESAAMAHAALDGDWEAARAWHHRLFPLADGLLHLDTNPVPIKTALAIRGFLDETFRLPMCPMADRPRERLVELLESFTELHEAPRRTA